MATKILNLRQCRKSMAWMPGFKYRPFQPPYMHRRLNSTDREHEPELESTSPADNPPKTKLWEFVLRNDGHLGSFEKQVKDVEINRYQTTNQIDSRMNKGFSEMERNYDCLEAKLTFIQWQLGLIGTAMLGFLGFVGYGAIKLMDIYISQIAPDIPHAPTTRSTGGSSGGAGKR